MGAVRNLRSAEIVAQAHFARIEAIENKMPPLRNIVFMGMGEPLDNFTHVKKAVEVLVDPRAMGFAPRYVTLSTVGSSPASIRRMKDLPIRVAWSIHAVDNALRKQLVPTSKHTMEELREAFLEVMHAQRDSLFVEMTMIDGLNDSSEHAHALADFLKPFPPLVRINLLPVNAGREGMVPSPDERVEAFREILRERGYFSMIRKPRGHEDGAACGQLAVTTQNKTGP
jgi:23S rRNA (adenine2503-C2)-methyltransferase